MKRVLFLSTHLGSGHEYLSQVLKSHTKIQEFTNTGCFSHPDVLMNLMHLPHKDNTSTAIYMTTLLKNESFNCDKLCEVCKFVYLIRPPKYTLNAILHAKLHNDPQHALNYYMFRLRRLSQMAKMTPGAVFLTYDDLVRGDEKPLIEEYLNLKTALEPCLLPFEDLEDIVHTSIVEKGQEIYEKYLRYMKSLPLHFPDL